MRNTLLVLLFLLIASFRLDAQQVVFDPATYDAGSLPAGMEIVDIEGTAYLQVVVDGWNSSLPLEPLVVNARYSAFTCEAKYAIGTSGYALNQVNTFLKLANSDFSVEIGAAGAGSTADFAVRSVNIAAWDTIGNLQVAGQETTGWSAVAGDTLWVGKITLTGDFEGLIPGFITRETFGTLSFDTGNPVAQPTGYATSYNWTDVTDFTSVNGHIEGGSDSSIRINTYGASYAVRGELVDPSLGAHALIVNRDAYLGSWDTLVFLDIDLTGSVATAVEFAYAKNPNWYINNDTNVVNVEYSIDGADWVQMDTSLIDTLYKGIWEYISLPINYAEGSVMDVRLSGLNTNQVMIDDLGVYGMILAPQGTSDFTVENVVVGAIDDAVDYTCNLHAVWDADSIYMDFVIADDSIVGTGTEYQIDNLEIYFDMDNSKNVHWPRNGGWVSGDATYDANDYQLRLVADSAYTAGHHIHGGKLIYAVTDTGYNFTLNICWDSLLVDFVGAEDSVIGFDVLASDNDAVASDPNRNQVTLNSPTDKPFNDPSLFATFLFRPEGRFEIIPDEENPSAPANYAASCADTVITITWDNATDNIAVLQYEVRIDGAVVASPYAVASGNQYIYRGASHAEHSVSVRALDNYGNAGTSVSSYVTCEPNAVDPIAETEFRVYPNPAANTLNIEAAEAIQSVAVISITGSTVMNVTNVHNQIDLSTLNTGMYLIRVRTENNVYSTTFVKE